ncbi:MAG: PAS domain-containing protein, partial [Bacteroidales bacterium]|nr:PAS domain-containing protein [Bacteroidales bacterium]
DLGTGILGIEQLKTLLNHLPVDITLVDEKDEVRYFSSPGKRIFPRLPAIIGRKVKKTKKLLFIH